MGPKDANVDGIVKPLKLQPPPLPKFPPPSIHRRHRNFRALSANVQRLISHSNTSLHPDDMNENHSNDDPNVDNVKKRLSPAAQTVVPPTNGSKFKHPLSKNTGKLTQFGNDLVIDDSDGGYVTPPENPYENKDNFYDIVNSNVNDDVAEDGIDKTPVNECPSFEFDNVPDQINGNSLNNADNNGNDDVYDEVETNHKLDWQTNEMANNQSNETPIITLKNASFVHSTINKSETIAINPSQNGSSAHNSPTLSQKSTDSETKSTKSQLFAIKAQVIEQSVKHSPNSPVSNSSGNSSVNVENEKLHPTESPPNCKENGQITIDLKRTKIRPLSSVSISSTSSSSSSASDEHSSNQNAISYLASVESLADHSENELAILSSSLTVTERACLEIIDSERSYVNDLGQVIRG